MTRANQSVAGQTPPKKRSLLRTAAIRLIGWPILVAVGALLVRWTNLPESMVFYVPSREPFATPEGYEDVTFSASDGKTLHGWFIRPRSADAGDGPWPAVLHCHGNAGNVDSHEAFASFLADHGIAVLTFDYRGYGRSSQAGRLTRDQLMIDARAALAHLESRSDVDRTRVGVFGVSLGATFAAALAAERADIRSLCTASAFSSWQGVASDHIPVLGWLLVAPGLDPADSVARLGNRPYLIVHGTADEIVNVRHARVLEDAARAGGASVHAILVDDARHNDVMFTGHGERDGVAEFFVETLAGTAAPK